MSDPFRVRKDASDFAPTDFQETKLDDFSPVGSRSTQQITHKIFKDREPVATDIGDQEIVFSKVSGVVKMHTKIDGVIISAVMS